MTCDFISLHPCPFYSIYLTRAFYLFILFYFNSFYSISGRYCSSFYFGSLIIPGRRVVALFRVSGSSFYFVSPGRYCRATLFSLFHFTILTRGPIFIDLFQSILIRFILIYSILFYFTQLIYSILPEWRPSILSYILVYFISFIWRAAPVSIYSTLF